MTTSISKHVRTLAHKSFRGLARAGLVLRRERPGPLFLLAHVRSGSTLLSHILTSHRDISGADECFVDYRQPEDLDELYLRLCRIHRRPFLNGRFILDQINHDRHLRPTDLAQLPLARAVILVREPDRTLRSMIKLFGPGGAKEGVRPSKSPRQPLSARDALEYYEGRLKSLQCLAQAAPCPVTLVRYEHLVSAPEEALAVLSGFLALEEPLDPAYEIQTHTGRTGDPSSHIRAGRIVKTTVPDVPLPESILEAAHVAYEDALRGLDAICSPTP